MLLQPDNDDFILPMIIEVEAHEDKSHWTLMKNSEVNNRYKNRDGNIKTIYLFDLSIARDYDMVY